MLVSYLLLLLVSLWGEFMQLKAGFEEDRYIVISVMSAMGEEKIIALKEDGTKVETSLKQKMFWLYFFIVIYVSCKASYISYYWFWLRRS